MPGCWLFIAAVVEVAKFVFGAYLAFNIYKQLSSLRLRAVVPDVDEEVFIRLAHHSFLVASKGIRRVPNKPRLPREPTVLGVE
jgi:hypothetical protein